MTPTTATALENPQRRPPLAIYVVRAVVAAVAVGLGLWALASTVSLFRTAPTVESPAKPETAAPDDWPDLAGLASGGWSFDGLSWQLSTRTLADVDVEGKLLEPPTSSAATSTDSPLDLLNLVRGLHPQKTTVGGFAAYRVSLQHMRAVLFTAGAGAAERPVLGRMVVPHGNGQSFLVEATPAPAVAGAAWEPPVPLPEGAKRLAVRRDGAGRVIGCLATAATAPDDLAAYWRQSGFEARPVDRRENGRLYAGAYRNRSVAAASWPLGPNQTLLLLLTPTREVNP